MKIAFTGGGTAGHIFPILALVREMKKMSRGPGLKFFYIGPKDDYGAQLLQNEGVEIKKIITGKLRRYLSIKNFFDIFKIPIGFFQSLIWLSVISPDLIFSKGGFGSFNPSLASKILRIPIFLHESDASPGIASKITGRWAVEIFTSFPKTEYFKKEKIICVGNPVRIQITNGNRKNEAKKIFNLAGGKPLLFIVGGSQGAVSINNTILEILPEMLGDFELIHQTGKKNFDSVKAESRILLNREARAYYHPIPFLNEAEIKHTLSAVHLVISRAGSGVIFEIAANGKPALLIPLPKSAQDHQLKNGYQFAKTGAAEVLEQDNLKPHFFLEKIRYLFSRPDILSAMANESKNFSRVFSSLMLSNYIFEYLFQTGKALKEENFIKEGETEEEYDVVDYKAEEKEEKQTYGP